MRFRGAGVKTIRVWFSVKQKSPFDPSSLYVQYRYPVTTVHKYTCTDNTCYNETRSSPRCNLLPHLSRQNEKANNSSEKPEVSKSAKNYPTSEHLNLCSVTSSMRVSWADCDQPRRSAWGPADH